MRFPDINENNGTKTYLNIPAADGVKAADASATFGFWMRQSDSRYAATIDRHVMGVATIATGLYINLRPNTADYSNPDRLEIIARTSWTTHINGTVDIPSPHMGSPMLVMVIVNPTYYHLVCAKPGGTTNVTSVNSAAPYGASWTSGGPFVQRPGFAFAGGHIEEMFFIDGEFPETTGVPDATLIANIADGSQDLDTLHTQFTSGSQRFRYKMQGPFDVSDDWALAGDMTWTGKTAATGHFATPSGPLRPQALMPTWSNNRVSQVTFATAGTMTGATASIKIEGGTYSGITPSAIQAKLVDEDGTTVKDWTEIDGAPSGGTWTGGTLTNVPATAGYLYAQIRAVDGGGSQIGDFVYSAGCRGTGLCIVGQSQSQGSLPATASGTTLPSGLRYMHGEVDDGAYVGSPMKHYLVGSGEDTVGRFAGMGAGQAALEWNAVFPGYPIEITWVGRGGTALSSYANGGANDFVWERLEAHLGGAMNDHLLLMYGHSSVTDQNPATYQTEIGQVITEHDAHVGAAVKVIHMPTSRYAQSGTDSNHGNCKAARDGARLYCTANPATTWLGTTTYHDQKEAGDLGPHSDLTDKGHRRVGAAWAWNAMSCIGAIEDEPLKIGAATGLGTANHVLTLTTVN